MGTNPGIVQKGETSTVKIVKFKGETTEENGHVHKFTVYTDDSVEIFDHFSKDPEGRDIKHKHVYVGDYPNGYIEEDHKDHIHDIISVAMPIEFRKEVIGKKSGYSELSREFSDLYQKTPQMTVQEFFEKYNELFYDIPAEGEKSHETIMEQSKEYISITPKRTTARGELGESDIYVDPKDEEIAALTENLLELQKQVDKQGTEAVDDEHPVFQNGSFLRSGGKTYYMQLGKKRRIRGTETYDMLKRAQGHPPDRENEKIWIEVTEDVLKGVDTGPEYTSEDINVDHNTSKADVEKEKALKLDPDDFKVNPENYPSTQDYLEAVEREIRQKSAKEDYLESKRSEYQRNIGYGKANVNNKVSDDEALKDQKTRLDEITKELRETRSAIIRYSKILQAVDPDGNLQNLKIDTSELKNIVTGTMEGDITPEEQAAWRESVFRGEGNTERMSRFVEGFGAHGGNSNPLSPSATMALNDPGTYFVEPKPSSAPIGFQENPKSIIANRSIQQMAVYSKIGKSSAKGDWYWAPKKEYQNKLRNVNPSLLMTSMFVWEKKHFEWVPKHEKRMFQGKVVDDIQ